MLASFPLSLIIRKTSSQLTSCTNVVREMSTKYCKTLFYIYMIRWRIKATRIPCLPTNISQPHAPAKTASAIASQINSMDHPRSVTSMEIKLNKAVHERLSTSIWPIFFFYLLLAERYTAVPVNKKCSPEYRQFTYIFYVLTVFC